MKIIIKKQRFFNSFSRRHAVGLARAKSRPSSNIANAAALKRTLPPARSSFSGSGQLKRPFSNRLAHTHNPVRPSKGS